MFIKEIQWSNHEVLGNLHLDFSKADGSVYNTIILAGENGTGKTTILETLATFLNLGSFKPFNFIRYQVDETVYTISAKDGDDASLGFHHRIGETDDTEKRIMTNRHSGRNSLDADLEDIRYYGVAYSKARSGFKTTKVKATTTQQLDSEKYSDDSNDDFTSIKQLLVDINAQDNAEWMQISKNKLGTSLEEFMQSSKMFRFENAFNTFFDNMAFKQVVTTDSDEMKIVFEKHGKSIALDDLSTGEKQIVFRGAYLLKNIKGIVGGIALIDEPELSMHPKWQQKILDYYLNLFSNNGTQTVQTIFATHSEYVLRAALQNTENVLIITLCDNNGTICARKITAPAILPTVTAAETNYLAFDIVSTDYHIELYGYLQAKTGCNSVKQCDDYIAVQPQYNPSLHGKPSQYVQRNGRITTYQTLPTYIRNQIDHPNQYLGFTDDELRQSIELLIELCR